TSSCCRRQSIRLTVRYLYLFFQTHRYIRPAPAYRPESEEVPASFGIYFSKYSLMIGVLVKMIILDLNPCYGYLVVRQTQPRRSCLCRWPFPDQKARNCERKTGFFLSAIAWRIL